MAGHSAHSPSTLRGEVEQTACTQHAAIVAALPTEALPSQSDGPRLCCNQPFDTRPRRLPTRLEPKLPAKNERVTSPTSPLPIKFGPNTATKMTAEMAPMICPHMGQFGGQGLSGSKQPQPPPPRGNRIAHPAPHQPTMAALTRFGIMSRPLW